MDLKFENLDDALAHIKKQDSVIIGLKEGIEQAIQDKQAAEDIAEDAISKANEIALTAPKETVVTIDKKKYKVLFGVDGLTIDELADDKTKLAKLVKIKSGALELVED
jgi:polyribonucleotide nucleotidyltransferase